MKRNAFTLVELLAVIVILSVVSLIAVPQLFNAIKSNNVDSYNGIVKNIILAAESYANNHNGILVQMPVAKLQEEGYLPSNLKNPVNNNTMNGCVYAIDGDTYYKEETCSVYITHLNPSMIVVPTICEYNNGYVWNFEYTNDMQEFVIPCNGTYKLEVWGAQGGNDRTASGGNGGYTTGNLSLSKEDTLYVGVGGQAHAFNGGGTGTIYGGGATHIGKTNNQLKNTAPADLLVVAGGGGGAGGPLQGNATDTPVLYRNWNGGIGGGTSGGAGTTYYQNSGYIIYSGQGGSQAGGGVGAYFVGSSPHGKTGSYGQGGASEYISPSYYGGGGGGGYYGGGGGGYINAIQAGGGGSSYIGEVTDGSTIAGNAAMPKHDGTEGTMNGNAGDGYARITLVSAVSDNHENTVTFETWDGTLSSYTKNVAFNTAIGELPIPTIENATLEGWYLDSDYTTKIDETYVVTEDITLYAMYKYDLSLLSNVGWSTYHSGNAMERKEYDSASDKFLFYVGGSATGATYYTHSFTTQLIPISSPCKINIAHSMMYGNNYSPSGTVQIKDRAGSILYQTTSLGSATKDIEVPAGGFSIYANYYGPGNWFVSVTVNSILLK